MKIKTLKDSTLCPLTDWSDGDPRRRDRLLDRRRLTPVKPTPDFAPFTSKLFPGTFWKFRLESLFKLSKECLCILLKCLQSD